MYQKYQYQIFFVTRFLYISLSHSRSAKILAVRAVVQLTTHSCYARYELRAASITVFLVAELYKYFHSQLGNNLCKLEDKQLTYTVAQELALTVSFLIMFWCCLINGPEPISLTYGCHIWLFTTNRMNFSPPSSRTSPVNTLNWTTP
jgi:hypothetical protein